MDSSKIGHLLIVMKFNVSFCVTTGYIKTQNLKAGGLFYLVFCSKEIPVRQKK